MKSHIAYTSAGNSQNGATSSRGTVILLQIKLHYSLLLIVIMTVLLCSILLFLMILCFFFLFLPCNKATFLNQSLFIFCTLSPWHKGHNCFSFFSRQHGWREREGTAKGRLSPVPCTYDEATLTSITSSSDLLSTLKVCHVFQARGT